MVAELSAELGAERGAELGAERGAQRGSLTAFECDLRREEDIARLFAFIEAEFGRIDVCVNNAGFSSIAPLLEAETALWREMLEVGRGGVGMGEGRGERGVVRGDTGDH